MKLLVTWMLLPKKLQNSYYSFLLSKKQIRKARCSKYRILSHLWYLLLFASPIVFASDDFQAYRLGHYNKAAAPLLAKTGTSAIADYYLGRMYLYGYGELRNTNSAIRYFTNAATKGYLPAIMLMAKYTLFKENNQELAVAWFKKAAGLGDISAQMFMAAAYFYGLGVKQHEDVGIKYTIEAAKKGNPIAQFTLAEHFIDSKHSSNNKLGLIWLNKSAAYGNPKALTKLASLYIFGKMVSKNMPQALALLNKAASQNEPKAMLWLGDIALAQGQHQVALDWYNRAATLNEPSAYMHIAKAYLQEKSPIYNPHSGYLWTLKAAQNEVPGAKNELAKLYQKGIGVAANQDVSRQWALLGTQDNQKKPQNSPMEQAALWLSNGKTNQLAKTSYQMNGIFNEWQNSTALKDNIYNQAPQMELLKRSDIFKPEFALIQPNTIPISTYYYALLSTSKQSDLEQWDYPLYPLNNAVEKLTEANNTNKEVQFAPSLNANEAANSLKEDKVQSNNEQKQAQYKEIFNALYFKAVLGEAQSQFEIGQMFEKGLGVKQNLQSAIIFYENAAAQQHLAAEYNLGLLYLNNSKNTKNYDLAINWLTDAAFKGNSRAQYVLSRILDQGKKDENGKYLIKPNHDQAISMLYIAAAQGFGLAEYELAERLARETDNDLNIYVKKQRIALIRKLYQGASQKGIERAFIPLAFYNAVEDDKQKQKEAYTLAKTQAEAGNKQAALLLGMLYDQGIGIEQDHNKAINWYKQAGENPVSQFILGTYIAEGQGISKDREKGIEQLKQAAMHSFPYAYFNLAALNQQAGKEFLTDLNTAYNLGSNHAGIVLADYYLAMNNDLEKIVQALQIYKSLANKGDNFAQLKLAYMLDNGLGGKRDPIMAQKWYTASAEQGNSLAQFLLGQLYQIGENGEPNYQYANEWYQRSASQLARSSIALGFIAETVYDNYASALKSYEQAAAKGDGKALYNMALIYLYGKGVPVDYTKAKLLFNEASTKGVHEATNQLAQMYFYGKGQKKDKKEALLLYKKAADAGNANALYHLALLTEAGFAQKRDIKTAIQYYKKAEKKGNNQAMLALARIYQYAKKDNQTSAIIYQKLAVRQNHYAQYRLGTFYIEGITGERSVDKGRQLLRQASVNGSLEASNLLRRLDAEATTKLSFIESASFNNYVRLNTHSPQSMYYEALKRWDRGDEQGSHWILHRLLSKYPDFIPAKKMYR